MDAAQFAQVMAQAAAESKAQIQAMQQHHAQQMAQLAAQVAAAAAQAAAPAAAAGPPRGQRLAAPSPFEGSSSTLDDWMAAMQRQFEFYNMPDDGERVRFASAHLHKSAWDWWSTIALANRPNSWTTLKTALIARFQPVTSAETARAKLIALSQGKQSITEYVDNFRRLLARIPDMGLADQLFQFIRGLRPALATQLRVQGVTTMDAAINLAVRVGSLSDMGASQQSQSASSSSPMDLDAIEGLEADTSATSVGEAPVTRAEFQQLLNAMRDGRRTGGAGSSSSSSNSGNNGRFVPRGPPTIPHLTPDQVKEYMDSGKCFGCGSKDHRSRQCPKRKIGADKRVSWSSN